MVFCDSHFHLNDTVNGFSAEAVLSYFSGDNYAVSCSHSPEEFNSEFTFIKDNSLQKFIGQCFGLHPQMPLIENAFFLESLLKDRRIIAVGETGHDFFTRDFKGNEKSQDECFSLCLDLAANYNVPVIIHNRKALEKIFLNSKLLSKLPFVLFHSFAFSNREAESILSHNVNGYFSFSRQICNGNKKSISCIQDLPLERLLFETDAPYQTMKGESATHPSQIEEVYKTAAMLKKISPETLCSETRDTFKKLFML